MKLSSAFKKAVEIVLVVGVIIVIWCVMSLPSVFFFMDLQMVNFSSTADLDMNQVNISSTAALDMNISSTADLDINVPFNIQPHCSDRFYRDGLVCKPECGTWRALPDSTQLILDILGIFLIIINLIVAVTILILVIVQRRKMLKFPQVIVLYLTASAVIGMLFWLVAYAGRSVVFCSERDYSAVYFNPTSFCIAAGSVTVYIATQLTVWWLFQVLMLLWKLVFPFHARFWEQNGRLKYIHIAVVVVSILFPAISLIISLTISGYRAVDYLPQLCAPTGRQISYYTLVLPVNLMLCIGVTLLWIIAWRIFKERSIQRNNSSLKSDHVVEIKLSIVLLYYMLISALFVIAFVVFFTVDQEYSESLRNYFICEATGEYPGKKDCNRSEIDSYSFPILFNVAAIVLTVGPSVSLVYVVSWKDIRRLSRKVHKAATSRRTASSSVNDTVVTLRMASHISKDPLSEISD